MEVAGWCMCVFKSELSDDNFSKASKITAIVSFSQKRIPLKFLQKVEFHYVSMYSPVTQTFRKHYF